MSVGERDEHTGYLTTGHEWNGITELNTPVPRAVYVFFILSFVFSVGYWVLMPAWPIGTTYTKGLLGLDQRDSVRASLKEAALERAVWNKQIETQSFADIQANAPLMTIVRQTGRVLFRDNCAACHGIDAKGGPGFPNLTSGSWLWGGDPEAIAETIRVGINSSHPNTRTSQMLAFGRDQLLSSADIGKVAAYVRTLSNPMAAQDAKPGDVEAGKSIFATNCASCHGDGGKGKIRRRRDQSHKRILDLWRRSAVDRDDDLGRPSGPHAGLGRSPLAARSQNSGALRRRSRTQRAMSKAASQWTPSRTKALVWLAVALCLALLALRERTPALRRGDVAAGLRCACAPR